MSLPTSEQKVDSGHCLCKAVTFTVQGSPIYNVICHCENCRRQGGSTLHCASIFLKSQYTLHSGADNITTYTDTSTQSCQPLYRSFCKTCGSKVFSKTPLNENIISVSAGVLQDAGRDWVPVKEQFCGSKCGWVPEFGDAIKERFSRGPTGGNVKDLAQGKL
jgi:hypothetical protein